MHMDAEWSRDPLSGDGNKRRSEVHLSRRWWTQVPDLGILLDEVCFTPDEELSLTVLKLLFSIKLSSPPPLRFIPRPYVSLLSLKCPICLSLSLSESSFLAPSERGALGVSDAVSGVYLLESEQMRGAEEHHGFRRTAATWNRNANARLSPDITDLLGAKHGYKKMKNRAAQLVKEQTEACKCVLSLFHNGTMRSAISRSHHHSAVAVLATRGQHNPSEGPHAP
ncbi:hypothetical protein E1301_Tti015280 [Triplophysa tibetana]|uniref:Uncharacterized protein n=1 Tax=Triplophysa tibetana TaxID=1572043 RepID=A0A5A9PS04_9TELE|nr:hypothetical protein E1301_Tti015280 [Triplophysa tibetana]